MDLNTLRGALRERPFKPFTIRLADGRSEFIPHPEFVAVGPRIVVVVRKDNTVTHIEPLLIVSLEHEGNGRKGRNGPTRRKPRNP